MSVEIQPGKPRLDLSRYELSREGLPLKLERQPMELLIFFVQRKGQLVTRQDIVEKLWGKDVFVDVDRSINAAIRKIRSALKDDPNQPRYLETIVGKGYRLIGDIELIPAPPQTTGKLAETSDVELVAPPQFYSSGSVVLTAKRHKSVVIGGVVLAVIVMAMGAAGLYLLLNPSRPAIDPLGMKVTKLTDDGKVANHGTISPDGRNIAYVMRAVQPSLWVKQIATGGEVQVVPPQPGFFAYGLTFSSDGNYIYYVHTNPENDVTTDLYAVASMGGSPRHIATNVWSAPGFSPDGKQIVFKRFVPEKNEDELVLVEGGAERVIVASASMTGLGVATPSWTTDGKLIAMSALALNKDGLGQVLVFKPDGTLIKTFTYPMVVHDAVWMPDGRGMFLIGATSETRYRPQIKYQPYPSGQLVNVTNDLNQYHDLSITADGKALASVQQQIWSNIFIGEVPVKWPAEITFNASPITSVQADGQWLSWTAGGKLITMDAQYNAFLMDANGQSRSRVLERENPAYLPSACGPDAIVLTLLRGNHLVIYKYKPATGDLKQVSSGEGDWGPACTPDGKAMFYQRNDLRLMRISSDGGKPVEMASNVITFPRVSPNGKQLVYVQNVSEGGNQKSQFVVQGVEGGPPLKVMPAPASVKDVVWSPDGQGLVFVGRSGAGANLFFQRPTGGTPMQLTHFDTEPMDILAVAFSRDGKKVAVTRGRVNNSDVLMFSNFR